MPPDILAKFIDINLVTALQVIALGLIGGILSGFIGSGGAFFMTPGMMNLGVPGPLAVGSNITHKFGKAIVGSRRHAEMGHVDKKLSLFMLITAAVGIRIAVVLMKVFKARGQAAADLYISLVFVVVLAIVSFTMLRDVLRKGRDEGGSQPSRRVVDFLERLRLKPLVYFPVADVRVSLWVVLLGGLGTGYLAGTIGVGGFIGVPAMIYVFGVPAQVAAGSELFLAIFTGAFGALNYGYEGMIDLRLVLLLYMGSLLGIHVGAYGTKIVKESVIRLATGCIIALCVVSRIAVVPVYARRLGYLGYDAGLDRYLNSGSTVLLFVSGLVTTVLILSFVFRAYARRRRVQESISARPVAAAPAARRAG